MTLRVDARAVATLRAWCRAARLDPGTGGRAVARIDFSDEDEARFVVLGLGAGVEVVAPDSLRRAVAAELERMTGRTVTCRSRPVRATAAAGRRTGAGRAAR